MGIIFLCSWYCRLSEYWNVLVEEMTDVFACELYSWVPIDRQNNLGLFFLCQGFQWPDHAVALPLLLPRVRNTNSVCPLKCQSCRPVATVIGFWQYSHSLISSATGLLIIEVFASVVTQLTWRSDMGKLARYASYQYSMFRFGRDIWEMTAWASHVS